MQRSSKWILISVVAFVAFLSGCGGGSREQPVGEVSEPVVSTADTCDPTDFDWPAGATEAQKRCSGPWQFYTDACCVHDEPKTCAHANGYTDAATPFYYSALQYGVAQRVCTLYEFDPETRRNFCIQWKTVYSFPACNTFIGTGTPAKEAYDAVAAVRATCTARPRPEPAIQILSASAPTTTASTRYCTVAVAGATRGHGTTHNVCETAPDAAMCGTYFAWASCTGAAGERSEPPSQCPANRRYSALDQDLLTLRSQNAKVVAPDCLSGEADQTSGAMPVPRSLLEAQPTAAQVQSKFSALATRRATIPLDMPPGYAAQLDQALVRHAKLLHEFYGHLLEPLQQQRAAEALHLTPKATTYVSDLTYTEAYTYAPAKKDASIAGNPLRLKRDTYTKGLGTHTQSDLTVDLGGQGCTSFKAVVGVDDECGAGAVLAFEVWGDNVLRYSSGNMSSTAFPGDKIVAAIDVDITGVSSLRLRVVDTNGTNWCDHGDWAAARVTCDLPAGSALAPWTPACGTTEHAIFSPPAGAGCDALGRKFTMCDRLGMPHAAPEAAALEAGACVSAFADVQSAAACTAQPTYAASYGGISTEVLVRAFSTLPERAPAARFDVLQQRLALMGQWYWNRRGSEADATELWRDSASVAAALAQGAHWNDLSSLAASGASSADADLIVRDGWLVDREILNAVATNRGAAPPFAGAPVLFVMADALKVTSDRLNSVDFLHDLACRFKACVSRDAAGNPVPIRTRASEMHALVGALPYQAQLTDLATTATSPHVWEWVPTFALIAQNHAALVQPAVRDATGSSTYDPDALLVEGDAEGTLTPAYGLANVLKPSRLKADHYASTGRFRPGETNALYTGLTSAKLTDVEAVVDDALQQVATERAKWEAGWKGYVSDELRTMESQSALDNALSELNRRSVAISQLAEDIEGLRLAATIDAERNGDFAVAYDEAVRRLEQAANQQMVTRVSPGTFEILPIDDRPFTSGTPVDVGQVRVANAKAKVTAGAEDLVHVSAHGQWSTVCALSKTAGAVKPPLNVPDGALTGPQGYEVTYSSSGYSVKGKDWTKDSTGGWLAAGTIAAGIGAVVGTPVLGGAILGVTNAAINAFKGIFGSSTKKKSSGTEYRTAASFNVGLRSPAAPFPEYPAGALLAVKLPQGVTSLAQVIDVEVVQAPNSVLVIDRPTDVYLVVNDVSCTSAAGLQGQLSVGLTVLTPQAGIAKQIQPAMTKAYTYVQGELRNKFVPQGRLLSTDLQTLQSTAMRKLYEECGFCDLKSLEQNALQFYESWVLQAMNQAERQIELNKLDRELTLATLEWEALAAQIEDRQRTSQVLKLLPEFDALALDEDRFADDTEYLARVVDRYLHPFLRARYPETQPSLATIPELEDLTSLLDWTSHWNGLAAKAESAVSQVRQTLREAHLQYDIITPGTPPIERPFEYVMVAIPKPLELVDADQRKILNPAAITWASDMAWASEIEGWAPAVHDLSVGRNPLRLDGVTYAKGIGAHSRADQSLGVSQIVIDVTNRGFKYFQADVGVDDEIVTPDCGSVTFEVWGDRGGKLWDSGIMRALTPTKFASVWIEGERTITLRVTNGDGSDYCDHADWAEARFTALVPPIDVYYAARYTTGTYAPRYRELGGSSEIWSAIVSSNPARPAKLTLSAEDLYRADTAVPSYVGQLKCQYSVPVIRSMEVFSANDGGSYNADLNNGRLLNKVTFLSSEHVNYASVNGLEGFFARNSGWLNFSVPPRYGKIENAVPFPAGQVQFVSTGAGIGLSPAGEFDIPPGARDRLDPPDAAGHRHTAALVLLFELEVRQPGSTMSWLDACP